MTRHLERQDPRVEANILILRSFPWWQRGEVACTADDDGICFNDRRCIDRTQRAGESMGKGSASERRGESAEPEVPDGNEGNR